MNPAPDATAAPPFSVRIDPHELRHAMRIRGLTGTELARRAGVSQATISHALNGRRIRPATLRRINAVLRGVRPLNSVKALVHREHAIVVGVRWGDPR